MLNSGARLWSERRVQFKNKLPQRITALTTDTARMGENELDRALVERVQQGDKRAFDLLVRKYQHKVIGLVSRYVRSHAECEDIAQESFIRAWRCHACARRRP